MCKVIKKKRVRCKFIIFKQTSIKTGTRAADSTLIKQSIGV